MSRADDRREPRRAEAVEGDAGDALWEPREKGAHARDVAVVLAGLVGGAEVDVLDLLGRDTGALDGFLDDQSGEVVRTNVRKRTSVAPDGRSDRGEDDRLSHEASLPAGLAHKIDADGLFERTDLLAAPEELADGLAALIAVVLREAIHVHADEAVGQATVEPASVLKGIGERLLARLQAGRDRRAKHLGEVVQHVVAEIAARDVDSERKRQSGLQKPPLAEVDHVVEPVRLVRQLALVDEKAGLGASRLDLV